MKGLIKKVDEYTYAPIEVDEVLPESVQNAANEKLYRIEQIEEELGISFIALYYALKDGIYYEHKGKIVFVPGKSLIVDINNKCFYFDCLQDKGLCCYFKDNRKRWALRKVELELPF